MPKNDPLLLIWALGVPEPGVVILAPGAPRAQSAPMAPKMASRAAPLISGPGAPPATMAAVTEPVAQYLCAAVALLVAALAARR